MSRGKCFNSKGELVVPFGLSNRSCNFQGKEKERSLCMTGRGALQRKWGYRGMQAGEMRYVHVEVMCFGQTNWHCTTKQDSYRKTWAALPRSLYLIHYTVGCSYQAKPRKNVKNSPNRKPVDNKWPSHFAWRRKKHNPPGWAELWVDGVFPGGGGTQDISLTPYLCSLLILPFMYLPASHTHPKTKLNAWCCVRP